VVEKKRFFPWKKGGGKIVFARKNPAKIVFARKNPAKFLPAKIDFAT